MTDTKTGSALPHQRFDSFVVFAEMRTGSNLLEEQLNSFDAITCAGELFNPHFVGHARTAEYLGYDLARREADPLGLLAALESRPGLNGFRFFHDHDPRVLGHVLADPGCAKIILTRNPLDSYISRKIAAATDQWKLGDVRHKRAAKIRFDAAEFETHVTTLQQFQMQLQHALQTGAQTAFYIGYDDLGDVAVLNGLVRWLGRDTRIDAPSGRLKRQNPEPPEEKLLNPEALSDGIARLDRFDLARTPGFEPRRGAMIGAWRRALRAPVLYMPTLGGPDRAVLDWLAALDGVEAQDLPGQLTVQALRAWQDAHPNRRCFTVLRHPLLRAHEIYLRQVVHGDRTGVRSYLERVHGIILPPKEVLDTTYDLALHRAGFLAFLNFVRANLSGQTGLPVQPPWASQTRVLEGFRDRCMPDHLLREAGLERALTHLAEDLRLAPKPYFAPAPRTPLSLDAICDDEIEAAGRAAYALDYRVLGFGAWRDSGAASVDRAQT